MTTSARTIRWKLVCAAIVVGLGVVDAVHSQVPGPIPVIIKSFSFAQPITANSDAGITTLPAKTGGHLELESLLQIEKQIQKMLPEVSRCVVAIEGGTGVITSSDGYILTASHIAKKAGRTVKVLLPDGRTEMATTLGTNFNTDTAAIRLDSAGPWPFVEFEHSSNVELGDWCVALGYPLSFPRGKPAAARLGRILATDENRIVSDCPIMGGDSGGPLFNLQGDLIGISSRVKHDIRVNLHIPIETFRNEWDQLSASIDIGKTDDPNEPGRAYLGVLGETDRKLVRIRHVHKGSPAAIAGWQPEDVLLEFSGEVVDSFDDVRRILNESHPGDIIVAKLNRYGKLIELSVQLGRH